MLSCGHSVRGGFVYVFVLRKTVVLLALKLVKVHLNLTGRGELTLGELPFPEMFAGDLA